MISTICNENFEKVSNCIEVLLKEDLDGLKFEDNSSPLVKFMRKSKKITENRAKKLMETFMRKSFIGAYQCDQIYAGNTAFSKNFEHMKNLLENAENEKFKVDLKSYLKQKELQDEEGQAVQQFNIAAKLYDEMIKSSNTSKVTEIKSCNISEESKIFLEIASDELYDDVVAFVLQKVPDADVISSTVIACQKGFHKVLCLLLVKIESFQNIRGLFLLHGVCDNLCLTSDQKISNQNFQECFKLLVEKFPESVNEQDKHASTPLHYVIGSEANENEIIILLEKGSFLGDKNKKGERPVDNISRNCLKTFLDSQINFTSKAKNFDVDLSFITKVGMENFSESFLINRIRENREIRPLIAHPVISSFIFLKWWKLKWFIVTNFITELCFLTSLSMFIFSRRYSSSPEMNCWKVGSTCVFITVIAVTFLRELLNIFIVTPQKYFKNTENILEFSFLLVSALTVAEICPFSNHIVVAIFIVSIFKFFKIFSALPFLKVSIYVAMLEKVTISFFKSFSVFIMIPVGFACTFNLVYFIADTDSDQNINHWMEKNSNETENENIFDKFQDPLMAVVKVFLMMTGEFGKKTKKQILKI